VKKKLLVETLAVLLLVLILGTIVLTARSCGCGSREEPPRCDRPVEIAGPTGDSSVWCNRESADLASLLDRMNLSVCRESVLAEAKGVSTPLFLRMADDCSVVGSRPRLSGRVSIMLKQPIDLNSADEFDLRAVPGIGLKLAGAIVESRSRDGPFCSVEELARVAGIGAKRAAQIGTYLQARCPGDQ